MFNTVDLISSVKKRVCLWNKLNPDYKNPEVRKAKWEEIGDIMYHDWDSCDAHEKYIRVQLLAKKWKNVRDSYLKEKRLQERSKNSGTVRKKREYNHFKLLRFLDDYKNSKYKSSEINYNEIQDSLNNIENQSDCSDSTQEQDIQQDVEDEVEIEFKPEIQTRKRSRQESIRNSQRCLQTSITQPQSESHSAAVKDFLLSLMPDVESLTSQQYMGFRLGVLNLLNNIIYDDSTNESWVISTLENTAELNK